MYLLGFLGSEKKEWIMWSKATWMPIVSQDPFTTKLATDWSSWKGFDRLGAVSPTHTQARTNMIDLKKVLKNSSIEPQDYYGACGASGPGCAVDLHSQACFYDSSFLGVLELSGEDRQSYLNGQASGEVLKIQPGEGQSNSFNTPKGKTLALANVFRYKESFYLQYPISAHQKLFEQLDLYLFTEDVSLRPLDDLHSITFPGELSQKKACEYFQLDMEGTEHQVLCRDQLIFLKGNPLNIPSLTVLFPPDADLEFLKENFEPLSSASLEAQRIRSLYPLPGCEYDGEKTLTPELDQENLISYSKGCFVGQEVFARIRTYGRTNRILAAMEFKVESGRSILNTSITVEGKTKGVITSEVQVENTLLTLGYLPSQHKEIGKEVQADGLRGIIVR